MADILDMPLDQPAVAELLETDDPLGVLSLYVDADPAAQAAGRPAWAVELGNALAALRRAVREEGPRERWRALEDRLEELDEDIAQLLHPAEPGRGRALFIPLSEGGVHRVVLHGPLVTTVVLEERPYVRPLVIALDRGRPAGVVRLTRDAATVTDVRLGRAHTVDELRFGEASDDWREMKGPAGANPAMAQRTAPQRDRFARRVDEQRRRFLQAVAGRVAALTEEERWDTVVLAGDGRLTGRLADELPSDMRTPVIRLARSLDGLDADGLADAVAVEIAPAEEASRLAELERARHAAAAGGAGAVGLADVLSALEQGRVARLLLDEDLAYRGLRAPDGRLLAPDAVPPDLDRRSLEEEPNLGERMIEIAIFTDAEVLTLRAGAARELAACGGVAAVLRW